MGDKEKLWAHKNNGVVKSKLSNTATCISFDRFIFYFKASCFLAAETFSVSSWFLSNTF